MTAPLGGAPGEARIVDRGYRRYDGPRAGADQSVRAVVAHSIQRGLGLRRTLWAKVLPVASVLIAYIPAIVFVGAVALLPDTDIPLDFLPSYGDYYGYVIAAIMLFVAVVAPEVLCTDRRTGMLGVYLASPLDRDSYLLGKALAIAAVLSLVCLGPPLLLLVANVLQNQGPEGIVDILATLGRVLGAGVSVTLLFTALSMGIASLTDRKFVATAAIILLFLVTTMVTEILTASGVVSGVRGFAPTSLSFELAQRSHGEINGPMWDVASVAVWGSWLAWVLGGFGVARYRLHKLPVTR